MYAKLLRSVSRWRRPAAAQYLTSTRPVSTNFGWDRGTPVDRYYLRQFFGEHTALIGGNVLEVGDSRYTREFSSGRLQSIDVLQPPPGGEGATVVGDLTDKATLPANAFDCFLCAQTFQYTFDISKAIEGAHHLLRPGGTLLATVPGISQISRQDASAYGEYWRFTTSSMERLCREAFGADVSVGAKGNVLAATALLQGLALEELPDLSLLDDTDLDYQVIVTVVARKER